MQVPACERVLVDGDPPVAIGEHNTEERVEQVVDERAANARDPLDQFLR